MHRAVDDFHLAFERQWFAENKPFGYEVQDVRLGGLQARIAAAGRRISAWLTGETDRIDELEAERLPYDTDWEAEATHENRWTNIISASNIT